MEPFKSTPNKKSIHLAETAQSNEKTLQKHVMGQIASQPAMRTYKKILLYGEERQRYGFPLVRDEEVGINSKYQDMVIDSYNDDDRRTTSTQLEKGVYQTISDLYEVVHDRMDGFKRNSFTQHH